MFDTDFVNVTDNIGNEWATLVMNGQHW